MFESYHPLRFRRERPGAARLGILFLVVAGVGIWSSLVSFVFSRTLPFEEFPYPLFAGVTVYYLVGYVVPVVGYSRVVDLNIPWERPDADHLRMTLATLAVPVVLVAVVSFVGNHAVGISVSELVRLYYAPTVGIEYVLWSAGITALLRGIGVGLLLFGMVQTVLREVTAAGHAAGLTAFFALSFEVLPFTLTPGQLDAPMVALFVLAVAVSVAVGTTIGLVYRTVVRQGEPLASLREGPYVPLVVVGAVGLVLLLQGMAEFPDIVTVPMWTLVVGAGAVAVERSRSVWPGVAAVVVYELAVAVTVYVEVVMGFAPAA